MELNGNVIFQEEGKATLPHRLILCIIPFPNGIYSEKKFSQHKSTFEQEDATEHIRVNPFWKKKLHQETRNYFTYAVIFDGRPLGGKLSDRKTKK